MVVGGASDSITSSVAGFGSCSLVLVSVSLDSGSDSLGLVSDESVVSAANSTSVVESDLSLDCSLSSCFLSAFSVSVSFVEACSFCFSSNDL